MRCFLLIAATCCVACAHGPNRSAIQPPEALFRSMPNPDGCYVQVWEGPKHTGVADFINGPQSYPNLRTMANQRNWNERIASLRVGPNAVATAFAEENFRGGAYDLPARTTVSALPEGMTRRISSLRIECGVSAQAATSP